MNQPYGAALSNVFNRGRPPVEFLDTLVAWAKKAPDEIFAPNDVPVDIFTVIKSTLGTRINTDYAGHSIVSWDSLLHRKAALVETMRVHGMMESSGNWNEGVDVTNRTSMKNIAGQETGVFQVSFDSTWIAHNAMMPFAKARGIDTPEKFIPAMKSNHELALEYYARLVRISIRWAGPLLRHGNDSVYPWLRPAAMKEFMGLLA